ncbi:MAG: hypothetical protein ACI87E_000815 [Mariniblastus sp.]|jgi:hypothetical protein
MTTCYVIGVNSRGGLDELAPKAITSESSLEQGSSEMKQFQILMIAVLATVVFCGSSSANCQDRLFGNGRILKRIREDLSSNSDKKPASADKSKSKDKKSTSAKRSSAKKSPTPAVRPGGSATPTRAKRQPTPTIANRLANQFDQARLTEPKPATNANRSAQKTSLGFGMYLESKKEKDGEKFVVTKVASKGNADQAGIRRGDVVLAVGGVKVASMDEFNEITEILGQGDQIEFEFARRDQEKKVLIQFGVAPKEGELQKTSAPNQKNDFRIAAEDDDKPQTGMRSVMNQLNTASRRTTQPTGNNGLGSKSTSRSNPADQRLIGQQRQQILQMQREIFRLKEAAKAGPSGRTTGHTILEGPDLSEPRK